MKYTGGGEEERSASLEEIDAIVDLLGNVVLVIYIEEEIVDPAMMSHEHEKGGAVKMYSLGGSMQYQKVNN